MSGRSWLAQLAAECIFVPKRDGRGRQDEQTGESRTTNAMTLTRVWTETVNGRIHTRAGGATLDRPPVVLVHGMVISSRYMVPTALELAPLCPVYAVDLPGYGDSVKPHAILGLTELADALAAWMDAMRLPSAHLVANSFGCQVLAEFALRHVQRVDRLVFQGPTVDPAARSVRQQLVRLIQNSSSEAPGLAWITTVDYVKAGMRRIRATIRMAIEDRIEDKLPGIVAPTLVVRGGNDPLVPQPWAAEVVRRLPKGELRVLPGLGHTINYTAPREFVATLRPFLNL
jgi:2-hydroxy-6-oxonona-2,4-dienedioate hydrolase